MDRCFLQFFTNTKIQDLFRIQPMTNGPEKSRCQMSKPTHEGWFRFDQLGLSDFKYRIHCVRVASIFGSLQYYHDYTGHGQDWFPVDKTLDSQWMGEVEMPDKCE